MSFGNNNGRFNQYIPFNYQPNQLSQQNLTNRSRADAFFQNAAAVNAAAAAHQSYFANVSPQHMSAFSSGRRSVSPTLGYYSAAAAAANQAPTFAHTLNSLQNSLKHFEHNLSASNMNAVGHHHSHQPPSSHHHHHHHPSPTPTHHPQNPHNSYFYTNEPSTPNSLKIPTTPTRSKSLSPSLRTVVQPPRMRHKQQQQQQNSTSTSTANTTTATTTTSTSNSTSNAFNYSNPPTILSTPSNISLFVPTLLQQTTPQTSSQSQAAAHYLHQKRDLKGDHQSSQTSSSSTSQQQQQQQAHPSFYATPLNDLLLFQQTFSIPTHLTNPSSTNQTIQKPIPIMATSSKLVPPSQTSTQTTTTTTATYNQVNKQPSPSPIDQQSQKTQQKQSSSSSKSGISTDNSTTTKKPPLIDTNNNNNSNQIVFTEPIGFKKTSTNSETQQAQSSSHQHQHQEKDRKHSKHHENENKESKKTVNIVNFQLPFNVRTLNLNNFPQNSNTNSRRAYSMAMQRMRNAYASNADKCLSILRNNLQVYVNEHIKQILDEYKKEFIQPAIDNMRLNCGEDYVNEDDMLYLCSQLVDEAKNVFSNELENNMLKKRKNENDSPNSKSSSEDKPNETTKCGGFNKRSKVDQCNLEDTTNELSRKTNMSIDTNTKFVLGKNANKYLLDNNQQQLPPQPSSSSSTTTTFSSASSSSSSTNNFNNQQESINSNSNSNTKSIYTKYPNLFKYEADQSDKQWLIKNSIINKKFIKCYILLYDDLLQLLTTTNVDSCDVDNNNSDKKMASSSLSFNEDDIETKLKPFKLPQTIIFKVKKQYFNYKRKQKQQEYDQQEQELDRNDDLNADAE